MRGSEWPPDMSEDARDATGELAVTYDQSATDGVGSQLQRIYSLFVLSRAFHIKYVHSPIEHVHYQGFVPFLMGHTDPDFESWYNTFFSLPSDDFDLAGCERIRVDYLNQRRVEQYQEYAAKAGRPVLVRTIDPYNYTDHHPQAFGVLRTISPYRGYRATGPIRVCIHVRWGDIMVPGRRDGRSRVLPNSYYMRVCGTVLEALRQQGAPFVVRLHTEVPLRRSTIQPDMPGMFFMIDKPETVVPADFAVDSFNQLPNLETVINVEPREVLDDFATADVLVLSRSSLGYVAALLNPGGLVVYSPWWHPPLPEWLIADRYGNLDQVEVVTAVTNYLHRRL